jgi:tetratricopeptide (TPR) repeat protein
MEQVATVLPSQGMHEHAYTERQGQVRSGSSDESATAAAPASAREQEEAAAEALAEEGAWAKEFATAAGDQDDFVQAFNAERFRTELAQDLAGDAAQDAGQQQQEMGRDASVEVYAFAQDNPFRARSMQELEPLLPLAIHNLARPRQAEELGISDALLVLEAAVQQAPSAQLWYALGMRQQENENDVAAIAALTRSLTMDSGYMDALLALAVSYTNENTYDAAFGALESWLAQHPAYAGLRPRPGAGMERPALVTNWLLAAARANPGCELDADVQGALGVVFNVSGEYGKAVDCFEAALSRRPEDCVLWNRLG